MRTITATMLVGLLSVSAAQAQRIAAGTNPSNLVPKIDIGIGYSRLQANAPPGISDDFALNGGFLEGAYHFNRLFAVAAQGTITHADQISSLGQALTLKTYLFGPQVQLGGRRFEPFARALFGGADGTGSYFPTATSFTTSASSFAYAFDGGLDINLWSHFALRPVEIGYLHTSLPNGSSNEQRHLMYSAGIVLKISGFHHEHYVPEPPPPPPPPPPAPVVEKPRPELHFDCTVDKSEAVAGSKLMLVGSATTEADHTDVMYAWMPDGGMIEGSGAEVRLNTKGMEPGHHIVYGHAVALGANNPAGECKLEFDVTAAPIPVPTPPPPPPAPDNAREVEFHANVPDAYFDYNSSVLRPDALAASLTAAKFLNTHREIVVRVEGFADERGSVAFNLILGQERAVAARNALIKAGVDPSRIEIISFGKAAPLCKEANEACYRQNRRAAFSLHP